MNIGFIFPNKDRRYKTIHLGLAYLAAYARLHHDDLHFTVLDTRVATRKERKAFFESSFDLIGITVYSPVYFEVKTVFNYLKEKHPDTPICLGGPYVTTLKEEIFEETPADFAVYGEGEISFNNLLFYLKGEKKKEDLLGIMFKDGDDKVIVMPSEEEIKSLDSLPYPAYDIFKMDRYPLHRLVTTRGCPFKCSWCNSSSIWDYPFRQMSARKIIDELNYVFKNYGKKILVFGDNTFNSDLSRIEEFCDEIIKRQIQILWSASVRADLITKETAFKMKKSGCYNVAIGIESANNDILEKIGKKTTIEKISEGIRNLKEAGIEIMSQYVIGSPFETLENIKESVSFAKSSGCDYINFYSVLPYKGTPQWKYIENYGKFFNRKIHEYHSTEPRIVFETPEFSYKERLEALRIVKKEGFYSNKDKKNFLFDLAKETSEKIQKLLPKSLGDRIYMILKSVYKLKLVKKNNV